MRRIKNKQGKFNLIDNNGEIVYKSKWLDFLGNFHNGYANIQTSKGWNWIDEHGNLLFDDEWFQYCANVITHKIAIVKPFNEKWQFRKLNGEWLTTMTFDYYDAFNEGFAGIYDKQKGWNFINIKGKILSPNMWFDSIDCFENGFGVVFIKDKGYNLINTQGNVISDIWFDEIIDYFESDTNNIHVRIKSNNYSISKNGNIQQTS